MYTFLPAAVLRLQTKRWMQIARSASSNTAASQRTSPPLLVSPRYSVGLGAYFYFLCKHGVPEPPIWGQDPSQTPNYRQCVCLSDSQLRRCRDPAHMISAAVNTNLGSGAFVATQKRGFVSQEGRACPAPFLPPPPAPSLLCHTGDMSVVSHSQHVCCVT